ncbi:CNP1-like family protein [Nitrosomonas cryotolerans]|uniref:CNP1-like family protein n=1 Tax=Nitrosomonas cryotolerans ATCC 49181 TaxID=1131553 RepID=A0A1N6IQJ6_9PROT|nr:CNP1-like family protein [Nitrosomonas cryotolerans]SFP34491.1 CNP1-like family protein [Nitrosomonas cryotolerans]SIO34276.1 CNP1-like family protein [Nitrosomonas cryotolerans ATCC 49181]
MKKFLLLLCALHMVACANQKVFKDEFDDKKSWVELQTQLPAFPEQRNLIKFTVSAANSNLHYVDTTSIKIGKDGVIRYSLVIQSSAGALNVSYEGIRCDTHERKLYALGRDDKTWSQPRTSEWQMLENVIQYYAQRELAKYFFCPVKQIVKSPEEAIRALKKGVHPKAIR